jgi:hypothetical protein
VKYDVFLSYAREDLSAVKTLVGAIEAEGLTVFWDRHIQLGSNGRIFSSRPCANPAS